MTHEPPAPTVLVVDDAAVIRRILTMTLLDMPELRGATIDEAENNAVAFDKLRAQKYALVVSETQAPGIDGCALVRRIREELGDSRTPILLIRRQEEETVAEAVMPSGASAFLPKPLSPHRIRCAVERLLKGGQPGTADKE